MSKYQAYPRYKFSGVEWLGEVPEEWRVVPIKHLGVLKGGAGFPHDKQGVQGEELNFHKVNALGAADKLGFLGHSENTISKSTANALGAYVFPSSSIVFAKVGAALLLSRIRQLRKPSCIDNNMMGLVVHDDYVTNFVKYSMQLVKFDYIVNPGAIPSLNEFNMGNSVLVAPPRSVQFAIANFLDYETAKIDTLIEKQQQLIKLLKEKRQAVISHAVTKGLNPDAPMKDSGVEWLGEVPAHWDIRRISLIYNESSSRAATVEELAYPILSVSIHHGISDKQLDETELDRKVSRSEDKSLYKVVEKNDLAYNMMRAWQGGFGASILPGLISPAYVVCKPLTTIDSKYFELALRTPNAITELKKYSRGITDFRLRLYWDEFKNIRIPVPPSDEVDGILEQILEIESKYKKIEVSAQLQINLLKERRTALISAAVTGKIDVRNFKAGDANAA